MNSLSWLIYLADVAGSVGEFFTFISIMCGIVAIVSGVTILIASSNHEVEIAVSAKARMRLALSGMIATGLVAGLIPNKQTVLMIAASEIGERAMSSTQVAGVVDPSIDLLKTWIAKTTEDLKRQK